MLIRFCEKDQQLAARLRKRMDFPFYQLIEYIPSISFLAIGRERFKKHQLSEDKLHSIGICIGFDLIINNNDRFRLSKIWSNTNQGNISNVLVRIPTQYLHSQQKIKDRQDTGVPLGEYYFIDHSGFLLDVKSNKLAADNFNKYIEKVTIFHDQLIQFIRNQLPCPQSLSALVNQIQFYTKYRLQESQVATVIEGIIYSTNMFIKCFQQKAFDHILKKFYRENDKKSNREDVMYWDEYWNSDLKKIQLMHLQIYYIKVSAIYATYGEVIGEIFKKVSANITKIKKNHTKKRKSVEDDLRSQKNKSNLSNLSKNQKGKSGKEVELDFLGKNDLEEDEQNNESAQVQQNSKQDLRKKRLKERLEAFQRKNYQSENNI